MSDFDYYKFKRLQIEQAKLETQRGMEELKLNLQSQMGQAKLDQTERHHQDKLDEARKDRVQKDQLANEAAMNAVGLERVRGDSALDLETHRANLDLQKRVFDAPFLDMDTGRKILDDSHQALAEGYKTVVGHVASAAMQIRLVREQTQADMLRTDQAHANALELERVKLENDLLRAEIEHERAKGRDEAQRAHELIMAQLQSRLRDGELTHAEFTRLVIRLTERSMSSPETPKPADVAKWVEELL